MSIIAGIMGACVKLSVVCHHPIAAWCSLSGDDYTVALGGLSDASQRVVCHSRSFSSVNSSMQQLTPRTMTDQPRTDSDITPPCYSIH